MDVEAAEQDLSPQSGGKLVAVKPPITCQCFLAAASNLLLGQCSKGTHPSTGSHPLFPGWRIEL